MVWDDMFQRAHHLNLSDKPYGTIIIKETRKFTAVSKITTKSKGMKTTYEAINLLM